MATTIDWESTLPVYVEQSTYSEEALSNLIESTMNGGPSKSRVKATETYQALNATMVLTSAQRATFYTFYKTTIKWGSLSFNFPLPTNPLLETVETKITSATTVPINGSQWRLSLNLTVLITE